MAKTSKRQRELARRRVERQLQRRMEARSRARRRATIAAATSGAVAVVVVIVVLAIVLSGGGSKKKNATVATKPSTPPTPSASPTALAAAPKKCAPIKPNPPLKGDAFVPPVKGKAPTKLVVKDVKKGHGKTAKKGSSLSVKYVGVSCSTGQEFDSTAKDGGHPFTVSPLGTANVIAGWNQGLIGVKAGGERELIIPASLGYGPDGSGPIKGNETLIFVIDVLSVK